jgi:hypothetical protein
LFFFLSFLYLQCLKRAILHNFEPKFWIIRIRLWNTMIWWNCVHCLIQRTVYSRKCKLKDGGHRPCVCANEDLWSRSKHYASVFIIFLGLISVRVSNKPPQSQDRPALPFLEPSGPCSEAPLRPKRSTPPWARTSGFLGFAGSLGSLGSTGGPQFDIVFLFFFIWEQNFFF